MNKITCRRIPESLYRILSITVIVGMASLALQPVSAQSAAPGSTSTKPKRDLSNKVVIANVDKHIVTFRAGKIQKDIHGDRNK